MNREELEAEIAARASARTIQRVRGVVAVGNAVVCVWASWLALIWYVIPMLFILGCMILLAIAVIQAALMP